ncbi:MAG TPA: prolyl oligopeptidase family serine peptidase [Candidatus Hydrogenedentes bacterium]|nr:prolyl oligopeptidase family serine peptidase [Candidatus Hydrogenedentota bacterium]
MLFELAILLSAQCAAANEGFLTSRIRAESGFDGAVTVVTEGEQKNFSYVIVEIPYRDIHGKPKKGQARLVVDRGAMADGKRLPAFCHVHYEKSVNDATVWCKRDWAVLTAHYGEPASGGYPLELCTGDSYNLAKAMIQWVRRQPFIDRSRLHLEGGSAGGYMTLAMSAEMFPVTCAVAEAPVVNWSYNLAYFEANKAAAKWPQEDIGQSPLPVVCAVTMLVDWSVSTFQKPIQDEVWYYLSPIAYWDQITNPVMVVVATGDMLVPIEQVSSTYVRPYEPKAFPEGYTRDFQALTPIEAARVTLEECIPGDEWSSATMPLQDKSYEITLDYFLKKSEPPEGPEEQDRPWSKDKQWSIVLCEEGPPVPFATHMRYKWSTSPDTFADYYRETIPSPDILSAAKLARLLLRYMGVDDFRVSIGQENTTANRCNFERLEQLDVVTGLLDYAAMGPDHAKRLGDYYRVAVAHPFGDEADIAVLTSIRNRLLAELNLEEQP